MRSSSGKRYFVWLPFWMAISVAVGIFIGNRFFQFDSGTKYFGGGNKFDAVLQYVNDAYVDTVNTSDLVESAIPNFLAGLDPHSSYISAKEMELMGDDLEGHFSGIGVKFVLRNDTIMVVNVIPGGPSQAAGIRPGDRVVFVNDTMFAGKDMTNEKVMRGLRGPKGTDVKLGIKRNNENSIIDITVERGDIPVNTVDIAYSPAENIGYIKISKFGSTTHQEFVNALAKLKSQGCDSFIVDLRQNSGGYLNAAIQMVNEYLNNKELIVYTEGRTFPRSDALADGKGTAKKDQLVVLMDEGSASASEVFAGAIQDHDRGLIIGRRSYGKGLVQDKKTFADGSELRLTIGRYYTPSGRSIQKPYEMGNATDYRKDLMNRYIRGEFDSQDSIKQNNEPLFHTDGGRDVHGHGGIMPDIFIPRDTTGINSYYLSLYNNGLIYEYAFVYTDKNRDRLEKFKTWQELDAYLEYQPLVTNLVSFAENKGVRYRPYLLQESRVLLTAQLKANIIQNVFGEEGFYPVILKEDIVLNKAIDILKNKQALPSVVKSGGYK